MKSRWIALCLAILSTTLIGTAVTMASDTDTVSCTATFTQLGVTVSPNTYDFGFGQANDWSNTSSGSGYFTVTNTGNRDEKIYIEASPDAGTQWSLAETNGDDTAVMKALGGDLTSWTSIHEQKVLKSSLASGGTVTFDLAFQFPSSTSTYDPQHFTVTISAVAAS